MIGAELTYFTLVADDSRDDLALIMVALRNHSQFRVVHQSLSGSDAINYLKGVPPFDNRAAHPFPHLLICDLKMPLTNGLHVLEWIKTHGNDIPPLKKILLTGSQDPVEIDAARKLGADDICTKPLGLQHLRAAADKLEIFMQKP